jgi:RNase P subunit RPR2
MTCLRCAGFMVEYHFIDIDVSSAHYDERLTAWRCVNCGYISEAGYGEPACETLLRPQ